MSQHSTPSLDTPLATPCQLLPACRRGMIYQVQAVIGGREAARCFGRLVFLVDVVSSHRRSSRLIGKAEMSPTVGGGAYRGNY